MARVTLGDRSPASILRDRLTCINARHLMVNAGVQFMRQVGLNAEAVTKTMTGPRGFYSGIAEFGFKTLSPALEQMPKTDPLRQEIEAVHELDTTFFGPLSTASTGTILDLGVTVYPGIDILDEAAHLFPEIAARTVEVRELLMQNLRTPAGQPSPVILLEDNPAWATEKPDIRNIRGNMAAAVAEAKAEAATISAKVDEKHGAGTMAKVRYVVVFGIGANDMYLKDLPKLINADAASQRKLISVFEPGQLSELPEDATAENTLYISISRGGGTQETLKSMEFAKLAGKMKYLVTYANKGAVKEFSDANNGITLPLNPGIGGRYMWAKGKIVLVPLALTASEAAWKEYTGAMVDFDNQFWPVGTDMTIFDLASHMYFLNQIYNIPGIFACSNNPVIDAGLRQVFQLHNEAVGKVNNNAIAFGAGMEMLPFAHAGADGVLGSAVSALLYGMFMFDTSYRGNGPRLDKSVLVKSDAAHEGLDVELLRMACVFPNQAKFSFAGAPNMMITMDGVNYRNLALVTAFYQNLMYPYLIMNRTNPDSNPNVDMVRKTTGALTTALLGRGTRSPIEVISAEIPNVMK